EFFSNGTKILLVGGENGKVDLDEIEHTVKKRSDIHYPKPQAISVTQSTELGTLYTPDEIRAVGALAKSLNLKLHMDGSRFSNAVAALGVPPKELTWKAGVDVLCFGGTKNGMAVSEAVVFFDKALARDFDYRCKQAGQLASKMRFLSAPWTGMLESGAWLKNAAHANRCAALLESRLKDIPGVTVKFPREANALFLELPDGLPEKLRALGWKFYSFIGAGGARFLCSWETTEAEIDSLAADISKLAKPE
ncbi:MAG TPA: beta-eliminating lyase-related protein, partial [Geobacteraceae bacterium]|nr:beta-eliminating lyase-related protein [Geobacteraceae bacterium]